MANRVSSQPGRPRFSLIFDASLSSLTPLYLRAGAHPAKRDRGFMNIGVRKIGPATILDLAGPLKLGEAEQTFRDQVQKVVENGARNVVINLSGVPAMDSSGIGALVRAYSSLKRAGGKCRFFGASKFVLQILKMVRLDAVLELFEDETSALAGL